MDGYQLAYWISDLAVPIEEIDNLLFLNRHDKSRSDLINDIRKYQTTGEAQKWINIFPISNFVDAFINENIDQIDKEKIISTFELCWTYQIKAKYGDRKFSISRWSDDEDGDYGLRLIG